MPERRWLPRVHYRRSSRHPWSFYWHPSWSGTSGINARTLRQLITSVWRCYFRPATIRKRAADVRFYRSHQPRWLYDILNDRSSR